MEGEVFAARMHAAARAERARQAAVDDAIAEWHDMDAALWRSWRYVSLHRWLGWTWAEYKTYVERSVLPPRRGLTL